MRIAIGTADGAAVCEHLARSSRFLVYEIDNGCVGAPSVRERGTDACGNHRSFTDILEGCDAVICGGVGQGAVNALKAAGTETIVAAEPLSVEQALERWLAGSLKTTADRVCLCGPSH